MEVGGTDARCERIAPVVGPGRYTVPVSETENLRAELMARAAGEVDQSLLDWYRELSMVERLRAASRTAAVLERMARVATGNR